MDRVQEFLLELGEGFALYARQRRVKVGSKEFVIDLLFFHVVHQRFVVVELKIDEFDPSHVGQLQFYVEWIERHLRRAEHQPSTVDRRARGSRLRRVLDPGGGAERFQRQPRRADRGRSRVQIGRL
jgi:hypothetical protein